MDNEKALKAISEALRKNDTSRLTEDQNALLDYFSFADDAIRNYGRSEAVNVIRTKFDCSRSSAYDYITGAEFVFGSRLKYEKAYHKGLLIEQYDRLIYAGIRSCIKKTEIELPDGTKETAEIVTDEKVYASLMKYMQGKERLLHLDQEDPPFDPQELLTLPALTANPADVGLNRTILSKEVIDIILKYEPGLLSEQGTGETFSSEGK